MLGNGLRVCIEVEQAPQARQQRRQHRQQGSRHLDAQGRLALDRRRRDPARVIADAHHPQIALAVRGFDAGRATADQKTQQSWSRSSGGR